MKWCALLSSSISIILHIKSSLWTFDVHKNDRRSSVNLRSGFLKYGVRSFLFSGTHFSPVCAAQRRSFDVHEYDRSISVILRSGFWSTVVVASCFLERNFLLCAQHKEDLLMYMSMTEIFPSFCVLCSLKYGGRSLLSSGTNFSPGTEYKFLWTICIIYIDSYASAQFLAIASGHRSIFLSRT